MKNKGMLVILIIMFIIAVTGGVVGFLESKKNKPDTPNDNKAGTITYKYFLEDEEVNEMPVNEKTIDENGMEVTNEIYAFSRFNCNPSLTGDFNTEEWKFVPAEEIESTCELYFVKAKYEVTITEPINATLNVNNPKYINREENGTFIIVPNEGYEFSKATCSDNKQTSWDEEKNALIINSITKDVSCKVDFKLKELTVNIKVTNGEGSTTKTITYGESLKEVVTPKDGYENPEVKCSNNQNGVFKENTFGIDKVTNDTDCTVVFKKTPAKKYTFKVELPNLVTILNGATSSEVEEGKDAEITMKVHDGYTMTLDCGNILPSSTEDVDATTKKYIFKSVKSNISCKATAKVSE